MAKRIGWVQACIVGAVLSGAALVSTDAFAQCCQGGSATGANMWTDGWPASAQYPATSYEPLPGWWTHGELEAGGRDFVNNPNRDGALFGNTPGGGYVSLGQQSLAKYYEYGIVAPGAFGGGHVATGSKDGLYQVDLWANNVASNFDRFSDQSYMLTASKAGEQYFTAIWDQTPHVYSTAAQTPYLGVGTSALTLPPGVAGPAQTVAGLIPFLHQTDIGIERDTAAASYRVTDPWMAWDASADYSHMDRTGTQVAGVVGLMPNGTARTSSAAIQVPAPVDDSTQNFGANGEYSGTSLWGQKFTFKAAYNGSLYTDNISNYTVQNPFCTAPNAAATCALYPAGGFASQSPFARLSTWPSNQANGFSETATADLPFQSRYVGTTSYTIMTQNAAFQPMTDNPGAFASPFPSPFMGAPWNSIGALPATSLHGDINTLLSNNVLTTKITPELTQKLTYRYYDFDNQTPRIIFPCWVSVDQTGPSVAPTALHPCGAQGAAPGGGSATENTISSLSISYIKQNAGYELNWRPSREWNFNAAYGYERYDYTEADAGFTNENSAKASVDWKPTNWLTARASGYYSDRIAGDYSYLNNVRSIQFPTVPPFTPSTNSWFYSSAYRQFMFDNRQRTQANFLLDVVAFRGVTITPSVKYKDDNYSLNPLTQEGVNDNRSTSAGVDVGWVISPDLSIGVAYYWEYSNLSMFNNVNGNGVTPPAFGAGQVITFDKQHVNTLTAVVKYAAIPDKLNFDVRYSISGGVDEQKCALCTPSAGTPFTVPYPNDTTLLQRLDATATYKFDPAWVHQMGFQGDLLARLRYTWERNSVSNWQNDTLAPDTPFLNSATSSFLWLAYDNPNYNVQMLAASLVARW